MNFTTAYMLGQEGSNQGLSMGEGLSEVSNAVNGIQKAMIYGIAAGPKVGKSTFADFVFVIQAYIESIINNTPLEIIYYSFEIDRISKEFDFASHFLMRDHNIHMIRLPEGVTMKGESTIEMSSNYLRGKLKDDNGEMIKVSDHVDQHLELVYRNRLVPLFGEYDEETGKQISEGVITFIEQKENPTGIRNYLIEDAKKHGDFIEETYHNKATNSTGTKILGYKPHNDDRFVIVVTDHLRKLKLERGFKMKETVDKYIEYSVEIRNWCKYSFIHIIHLNRSMSDMTRLKYAGDMLFPNGDDIKDTGNLSEDADFLFTMLNPNDERFNLTEHFGWKIRDKAGNPLYPKMRTIHLVESRHTEFPQHFRVNMVGGTKNFSKVKQLD